MFLKPFKIKSSFKLKGSDRKKFRSQVLNAYPNLTEDDLSLVYPSKSDVIISKIYAHCGQSLHIYTVDDDPLFFCLDKENTVYPTVYFLWKIPNLLKTFTTHTAVVSKLINGADLMLPGICCDSPITIDTYGKFGKGTLVAVNTTDNVCPVAIGKTAMDSMDMYMAARQGKAVIIMHVYKDYLWQMGSKRDVMQIAPLNPPDLDATVEDPDKEKEQNIVDETEEVSENLEDLKIEKPTLSESEIMDQLLEHCFLKSWKTSAKKLELPVLTSNFFRLHMVPNCPDGSALDVKKSSYKKISKFLAEMAERELIEVKEFPKGVENIVSVNRENPVISRFTFDKSETTEKEKPVEEAKSSYEDVYLVSGSTIKFFQACGYRKGLAMSKSQIRSIVTDYVKKNNLQKDNLVELDTVLHEAVVNRKEGFKEYLRWDEIYSRLLGKMSPAFMVQHPGQMAVIQKETKPIEITTAKRTGNKKVTLVSNLTNFGMDVQEFAQKVQVGVAASTSVGPPDNNPCGKPQVLIQGSQASYVLKLLLETYKIPLKHIKDLSPKPTKKPRK